MIKLDLVDDPQNSAFSANAIKYRVEMIKELLHKILPRVFFLEEAGFENVKKAQIFLNENLPIVKWSPIADITCNLSVILLCKHRLNISEFFYDMIRRWLIPNRNLDIRMFFASDFKISSISNEKLSIMEIIGTLKNQEEIEIVKQNIKNIETEIRLGVISDFQANRIREFKGLSSDQKTAMVQEKIGWLIQQKPKEYEKNIFSEMQQFLVLSRDEFKSARDYHHISRIISILHLIRKMLNQKLSILPNRRHIVIKFLKTKIRSKVGDKDVLGILVGLNFLKEHEIFEKNHFIKAINNFLPIARPVENSFYVDKTLKSMLQSCYLEVEKQDGTPFKKEEIDLLKQELPIYLKGQIEQLVHPVFMPRNEEEIVKNIVLLSHELKFLHDIPQVIISFDKYTNQELAFNLILLRVLKPKSAAVQELIKNVSKIFSIVLDRVKTVGLIRRKYLKEAAVFRIMAKGQDYFRSDGSIDINKARQEIFVNLSQVFGEIRDYNGGMMHQQNEGYKNLKTFLGLLGQQNELLLEKFFYSIEPAEMTAVAKTEILKNLFLMLLNAVKREETRIRKQQDYLFKQEAKGLFIVIPCQNIEFKEKLKAAVPMEEIDIGNVLSFSFLFHEVNYLGYAYLTEDKIKQKIFFDAIRLRCAN